MQFRESSVWVFETENSKSFVIVITAFIIHIITIIIMFSLTTHNSLTTMVT